MSKKNKRKAKKPSPVQENPIQKNNNAGKLNTKDVSEISDNSTGMKLNSTYFLFFLLAVVFFGCYKIISPYIHTIMMAVILSIIFAPIHNRIEKLTRGRQNAAAIISCFIVTVVVVIPIIFMLLAVIQQGANSFSSIYKWIEAGKYNSVMDHPAVATILSWVNNYLPDIKKLFPDLDIKNIQIDKILMKFTSSTGKSILNQGGQIAGNITALTGKFFLMIFTFFFFIRDEKKIFNYLLHLIPLQSSQEDRIMTKIQDVAKSALLGTFITAIAQGAAGGLAFAICGLPGLFWGMTMAFASLIPMVGTALIWVPATLYLIITGHNISAGFMAVWCIVIVGGLDNFVRPLFMKGGADMSTLLIFFAILGGINCFGLIGLLYGPLIFGLAMVLLYIYNMEFEEFLTRQDNH